MGYKKIVYNLINWINRSQGLSTPLGAALLNKMDKGIKSVADGLDAAYTDLDSAKLDKSVANKVLSKMPSWDPDTGVLTFDFIDNTSMSIDLNLEKIPVSFAMDKNGVITMTTEDGTKWSANVGDVIPDYAFDDGDRIAFSKVQNDDGSYTIKADIVKNSITADCLQPNFLADVVTNANAASTSAASASGSATNAAADAKLAQSYSVGGSGIRDGEDTDNAKYYAAKAKEIQELIGVSATIVTEEANGLMSCIDKKRLEDWFDPGNRRVVPGKTDVNTIIEPGVHYLANGGNYINMPGGSVNGMLVVFNRSNTFIKQVFLRYGTVGKNDHEMYVRTGIGTTAGVIDTWSDWVRITTSDDAYTHPEYDARTGVPTANVSPQHGGSFTISQPVVDATGHVTALNSRTISVPSVFVDAAVKTSKTYTLNTSAAYLIMGTGHASSGSTDSLSCGEYVYYSNSKWNRTQIFASSFPGMSISGNTLTITYRATAGAYSCDRYVLLRVK